MFRPVTVDEIAALRRRGCRSRDWRRVEVKEPFHPEHYRNVLFSGDVHLGTTDEYQLIDGIEYDSGISDATIHNCEIGDEVLIDKVGVSISNYKIGRYAVIRNVGRIACTENASCGNGIVIDALDETGGIPIPIFERMSSQLASLFVVFRRDRELFAALSDAVSREAAEMISLAGYIGDETTIENVDTIENVRVADHASISGATSLRNGTVGLRATIGPNVIACDFIAQSDSVIENGVTLHKVLVGQGSHLRNGFTAHESMFFANCTMECGEAAALIAGPYSTSMHKSTLLIGAMTSFFNAGSGSNQSNHLYKSGPMHWGSLGRGCKLGSDSYIMWPAQIGAFNMVSGRHYCHPDTSSFPFSYLIVDNGVSTLLPGVAIKSVGTFRDAMKWPKRDRRAKDGRIDNITTSIFNPFTCGLMMSAIKQLDTMEESLDDGQDDVVLADVRIPSSAIGKGKDLYQSALNFYWGEVALDGSEHTGSKFGREAWTDLGGQVMPISVVTKVKEQILAGERMQKIESTLRKAFDDYKMAEWNWVNACLDDVDIRDFAAVSDEAAESLKDKLLSDAEAELRLANPDVTPAEIAEAAVVKQIKRYF
ncbi:MAG: DUF4954 family protein [Muribaculaceae bacterium]|nr:DUF4954 family protein [Muribaculaceae bacterium]